MGLTKPRASQIFDLDYKQATRVITVSNVTLTGGAPAVVDGVSLTAGDRVLVTGQSTGSENGLYAVAVVGIGSDGTWVRTSDGNEDGEIQAGMIVMVTEGATYADTQWKLTTDGTIDIGVTNLNFVINILSDVGGANTQVQINDAGVLGGFSNFVFDKTTNVLSVTGNIDGTYILGNGSQLTGLPAGYADSDVATYLASGTVSTDIKTTAAISATGNITGGNLITAGIGTFGTITDGTVSFTSGNISGVDELRIDQSGAGLRMTNVGAFDNDGSDNFRIFSTNDLKIAANGQNGTAITVDATNQDVTITNDLRVDAGNLYIGGTSVTATATELNLLDGVTGLTLGTANEILIVGSDNTSIEGTDILTIDTASNYVGINQTSPEVTLHMTGEGAQTAQIRMEQYNDSADAPDVRTRRYRGTIASPSAIQSGDYLFRSNHEYYNGSALIVGGQFAFDNTNNANRTQFTVAVTTDGTSVEASSNDDVQFKIDGNDGGAITFNNAYKFPTSDGSANQILQTNGAGVLSFTGSPAVTTLNATGNIDSGNINSTGNVTGTYILGDGSQLTNLPTADGTLEVDARGGTVNVPITSGGGGGGGGVDSAGVSEIITSDVDAAFINALTIDADTLGGQNSAYHLDYGNFTNTPTIPSVLTDLGISDGTADQVLTTNGAGTFTFTTVSSGWVETSATYDATVGSKLFVDTSSSAVQVNLPASPSMGDEVYVVDAAGNSGTYNITVNRNGNKITGLDENFTIDVNGAAIILAYYNATRGWIVISK